MVSSYKSRKEEFAFRVYVTDAIKMYGEGMHPATRWLHAVRPKKTEAANADEIISKLIEGGCFNIEPARPIREDFLQG